MILQFRRKDFDDKIKQNKTKHAFVENELNELLEKVKAISTKGLTKNLINEFVLLMAQNVFNEGYYKIMLYLYQVKSILNIFMALPKFIRGNTKECLKRILKI